LETTKKNIEIEKEIKKGIEGIQRKKEKIAT
jgi:hypothetical protein